MLPNKFKTNSLPGTNMHEWPGKKSNRMFFHVFRWWTLVLYLLPQTTISRWMFDDFPSISQGKIQFIIQLKQTFSTRERSSGTEQRFLCRSLGWWRARPLQLPQKKRGYQSKLDTLLTSTHSGKYSSPRNKTFKTPFIHANLKVPLDSHDSSRTEILGNKIEMQIYTLEN